MQCGVCLRPESPFKELDETANQLHNNTCKEKGKNKDVVTNGRRKLYQNVKLFLSQKSRFDLVEKIKIKIKIARAHHFFNLQRMGNKKFFMWPQFHQFQENHNEERADISICTIGICIGTFPFVSLRISYHWSVLIQQWFKASQAKPNENFTYFTISLYATIY